MNEFRWHPSWRGSPKGHPQSRRVTRDPFIEAHVYMNAHDDKTWVGNIENHGSMGSYCRWPFIGNIQFNFKTRADAKRWAEAEIAKVRRRISEHKKQVTT